MLKNHTLVKAPSGPKRDLRPPVFMWRVYRKCGNSSYADRGKNIKCQGKIFILENNRQHILGVLIIKGSHVKNLSQTKLKNRFSSSAKTNPDGHKVPGLQ